MVSGRISKDASLSVFIFYDVNENNDLRVYYHMNCIVFTDFRDTLSTIHDSGGS